MVLELLVGKNVLEDDRDMIRVCDLYRREKGPAVIYHEKLTVDGYEAYLVYATRLLLHHTVSICSKHSNLIQCNQACSSSLSL